MENIETNLQTEEEISRKEILISKTQKGFKIILWEIGRAHV